MRDPGRMGRTGDCYVSLSAMSSADRFAPPVATTMYCCPFNMQVIGAAVGLRGNATSPTTFPVALS
jgi:hypothetical protein